MFLLVGLGNPGPQYSLNRHNIGFMILDTIARTYNFPNFKQKFSSLISEGTIQGKRFILCKPMTFMNLSGKAVQAVAQFYKIPADNIYVFHDELDAAPGRVKIKKGGGAGGHNGLRSIDQHLGSDYWRVRLGIGHPGFKNAVSGYVLSNFEKEDEEWLTTLLAAVSKHVGNLVNNDPGKWLTGLYLEIDK